MLDPDSLAAFIAIHNEGGFLAAANRLAIAQSVVSKRLLLLEDQLGVRLFDRDRRRRVVLTHEGEELLPAARATLVQLSAFQRQGQNIGNGQAGELRISYVFSAIITGVPPDFCERWARLARASAFSLFRWKRLNSWPKSRAGASMWRSSGHGPCIRPQLMPASFIAKAYWSRFRLDINWPPLRS